MGGISPPWCLWFRTNLHCRSFKHFNAHYVDGVLIGVNVRAHHYVMTDMILQSFRVDYVPGFVVFVGHESDLVAILLNRSLNAL